MSKNCLLAGDIYVPVKIEENDLYTGIKKLLQVIRPSWPSENIKFKLFTDGITNKLVACQHSTEDEIVLVRIYGNKTDLLIDRNAEIRNIKTLNVLGLAPQVYGIFENGLAYQYYPGVTLNVDTVLDEKVWPLVAKNMAKMHKVDLGKEFLCLLPEPFNTEAKETRFVNSFGSITKLRIEFERLKSHLTKTMSPIVFAHNDLLLGNVIYNKDEGTISFIDYEYATYNYQAKYPSKDFQISWIREYLTEYADSKPSEEDIERVYDEVQLQTLASHFLWGVWSLVQFEHSDIDFDFGRYAEVRLNRYYELKNKTLKEFSRCRYFTTEAT
ncbi:Choline/ethanolamine kinase [Operophtera brumata]|uniref:ethanolamine kinase n=1 Tax=Operophtera brumata TaxID=104452 RepID=A0A0L7LJC1_OPEBR|nr:Choline/ethanolamine kinase [Operophtera brumata]